MKVLKLKTHHFQTKLSCQKPMLKQIEWEVQNGPITENGVLAVTTLFFWKICWFFVDLMYHLPKYPYSYFLQMLKFYLKVFFPFEWVALNNCKLRIFSLLINDVILNIWIWIQKAKTFEQFDWLLRYEKKSFHLYYKYALTKIPAHKSRGCSKALWSNLD